MTRVPDGVRVRHDRDGDLEPGLLDRAEHARRRGAVLERATRGLLDHRPVHHGIRERDPDLDRVGAGDLQPAQQLRVDAGEPAGHVRDEDATAGVRRDAAAEQRAPPHVPRHRPQRRADRLEVLVAPAGQVDEHERTLRERAPEQPADRVGGFEGRQDAFERRERTEPLERLVVGDRDVAWRGPRPSGTRARDPRPGSPAPPRSNASAPPAPARPAGGRSTTRAARPARRA